MEDGVLVHALQLSHPRGTALTTLSHGNENVHARRSESQESHEVSLGCAPTCLSAGRLRCDSEGDLLTTAQSRSLSSSPAQLCYSGPKDHLAPLPALSLGSVGTQRLFWAKLLVTQSCPTVCDPMDGSSPDSSVHGIFPGKNTGVGCHFPSPGDRSNPEIKLESPALHAGRLVTI